jgi:PST family polysaccharide transporter
VAVKAGAVARASSWVAIGVVTSKGLSHATAVALAHYLAPEDFGVVALAAVATDFVALLQDLGLSPALVQQRGDPRTAAASALRSRRPRSSRRSPPCCRRRDARPRRSALATIMRVLALGTPARGLVPRALLRVARVPCAGDRRRRRARAPRAQWPSDCGAAPGRGASSPATSAPAVQTVLAGRVRARFRSPQRRRRFVQTCCASPAP